MFDTLLAKGFTTFAQGMVKVQPVWDKYKAIISLVIGILIGWLIIGWALFPLSWENATPAHLREDWRSAYLGYTANEYVRSGDLDLLRSRLGTDIESGAGADVPWVNDEEQLANDIETAIIMAPQHDLGPYVESLNTLERLATSEAGGLVSGEVVDEDPGEVGEIVDEEPAGATGLGRVARVAGIALVLLLIFAGIAAAWYLVTNRTGEPKVVAAESAGGLATEDYDVVGEEKPVKSFSTPYVLGDDYFDPSFSIEIGNDFLGECGIGISETLGAGDPKKVTAFEAWLFDKSDIRTVTTVLATEFAYNDPDLRAKLEPKGEVVLLEPGKEILLETSVLRVKARIKGLEYAQGASLPPESFVQKVNFELQAWVKHMDEMGYEEDTTVS